MDHLFNIILTLIESFFLYRLTNTMLSFRYSKEKSIYPFITYLALNLLRYIVILYNEDTLFSVAKILAIVLMFIAILLFYTDSVISKLIWFSVNFFITTILEVMSLFLISFLFHISTQHVLNSSSIYIYCIIISKFFNLLLIELIVRKYKYNIVIPESFKIELVIILILDFLLILTSLFLNIKPDMFLHNWNMYITSILIIVLFISGITVSLCYKLTNLANTELEYQLKMQQIEMENKLNGDLGALVNNLRSLRHDMNNHTGIMKGLLENKEYDLLEKYLSDICNETDNANDFLFVENQALLILLNSKISKIQQKLIQMEYEIEVNEIKISDKDICTLLGNIIDNAIEATEKNESKKYIKLIIKEKNNSCFIHCENTFFEPPIMVNGKFITTKRNSINHGIGTENIKSIVKKYNGTIDYSITSLFAVSIMIPYDISTLPSL